MCEGGRQVADFVAGTCEKPDVPELAGSLTTSLDRTWVVWAYKLAWEEGDHFVPCRGVGSYPAEAQAECAGGRRMRPARSAGRGLELSAPHTAPDPSCTCGFYALSDQCAQFFRRSGARGWGYPRPYPRRAFTQPGAMAARPATLERNLVDLTVVLSGRVLVFEWPDGGFLFRAARQTVVRVVRWPDLPEPDRPDDPGGHLVRLPRRHPFGAGPVHLPIPEEPKRVAVRDDPGWCALAAGSENRTVLVDLGANLA